MLRLVPPRDNSGRDYRWPRLPAAAVAQELGRGLDALLVLRALRRFGEVLCGVCRLSRELARFRARGDLARLRNELLALLAPRKLDRVADRLAPLRARSQAEAFQDRAEHASTVPA